MKRFNVRVYGIHINERNELLVSDESFQNESFTKFPGGGLEWGEGPIDCLKREFDEEFKLKVHITNLFYTTDFFQESAFHHNDQIISIYYTITIDFDELEAVINSKKTKEQLRWISLENLTTNDLTFPIDKHVVELLKQESRSLLK